MKVEPERRILVTGANGFVGSAIMARLRAEGRRVTGAVRRPGGAELYISVDSLGVDADWSRALKAQHVVIHTAARVHVLPEKLADPSAEFRRVNVAGTLTLARQAVAAGVRRFIFISSIKVNGEATQPGTCYGAADPSAPQDAYAVSKLEAENGLRQLAGATGMEIVIVRAPLVYGPGVKGNFLRLLRLVERGVPLPFANTDNRRSLIHVRNLADFVIRCIDHPAAAGETFLVADGEDLSTGDLVKHLAAAMARTPRLFPVPLPLTRSLLGMFGKEHLWQRLFGSLRVDAGKASNLLGWRPPVTVKEGLEEAARWYTKIGIRS